MHIFCFNDCIPSSGQERELVSCLENTIREYDKIRKQFPKDILGVVTSNEPSNVILNDNNCTLADCVLKLEHSIRRIGFTIFKNYPIEVYYENIDEDILIKNDYIIKINNIQHNAINAKIVSQKNGILFSLALHSDIKKNCLDIFDKQNNISVVNNLYGELSNTEFISRHINQEIIDKLGNYEKLLFLLNKSLVSERFKKGFEAASAIVQQSIINHFQIAINRNGVTRFYSDGNLIKDVTPEKETKIKVFELRIFDPIAYRIYFFEKGEKIYLALAEQKPSPKVQDNHIKSACSTIHQLILLEN